MTVLIGRSVARIASMRLEDCVHMAKWNSIDNFTRKETSSLTPCYHLIV